MSEHTSKEILILSHLVNAWNEFIKLDSQHPDEKEEFRYAIHLAQQLVAMRLARRVDPVTWPTHLKELDVP